MKATWKPHEKHGELTERSDLPDSVFAFPKERKEPLTDASRVRNAIARFDQVTDVSDEERALAFANIEQAADYYGVDMTESRLGGPGRPAAYRTARRGPTRVGPRSRGHQARAGRAVRGGPQGVETKRDSGVLTEEARKAVETKRRRDEL
jgi:hypothetical protein